MIMYGLSLGASSPLSSEAPSASVSTLAACAAPPAQANLPLGAPFGITAPLAGAMGGQPAPAELPRCRVGGCRDVQVDWHTRMCDYHLERFLDRVHDHNTQDSGELL